MENGKLWKKIVKNIRYMNSLPKLNTKEINLNNFSYKKSNEMYK